MSSTGDRPQRSERETGKDNDKPAEASKPGGDRPEPMDQSNRRERGAGDRPKDRVEARMDGGRGPGGRNAESKEIPFPKQKSEMEKQQERWERKLKVRLD